MHKRILAGGLAAAFALAFGAAQAQTATNTDPAAAGRPAETGIDNTTGKRPEVVDRAAKSRPAQATKRGAKKAGKVAKKAGHRTADAMRSTGGAIEQRLPKGGTSSGSTSGETGTQPQR